MTALALKQPRHLPEEFPSESEPGPCKWLRREGRVDGSIEITQRYSHKSCLCEVVMFAFPCQKGLIKG